MINIELVMRDLEDDEGFVSHAYEDTEGYLTIGYGRLIDRRRAGGITKDEARVLMENDIKRIKEKLETRYPRFRELTFNRQRALINMAYNLGFNGLMGFKKMIKAIDNGHWDRAYIEALDSKWAKQVGTRSHRIAKLLRDG